ncbi:MAG TPA: hypothetical protein VHH11_06765 [Gammaproteobacteria bacterium]|jgi:hypothetical protein|nr:hypothetical protein [Gammaproteobacteria bacterium]
MLRKVALAGLCLTPAAGAWAADNAVGIKLGALGLGVEYTRDLGERWAVRGGINGSQLGFDSQESGIDYKFDFVWDSLSVAVDLHPLKSPFRLSAGILRDSNRLDAESRPTSNITIGNTSYTPAQVGVLTGRVDFKQTAPFLGVGWDWSRKHRHFGMSFDLGVLDQGAPNVALKGSGTLLGDPSFQQDIAREEAQLRDSLHDLDLLPYATLGFVFRF